MPFCEAAAMQTAVLTGDDDRLTGLWTVLGNVRIQNASASVEDDRAKIMQLISEVWCNTALGMGTAQPSRCYLLYCCCHCVHRRVTVSL